MPEANRKWILASSQCVPGLGQAELLQCEAHPNEFLASILLNSYESNCIRDWLALRWKSASLQGSCIAPSSPNALVVSFLFVANSLPESSRVFEAWLKNVTYDRQDLEQSRR